MSNTTIASPRCFGHPVDPDHFGQLLDSSAVSDPSELHQRMARDGYLFLPSLLGRDRVMAARAEVCLRLQAAGFLQPGTESLDAIAAPGRANAFMPDVVAKSNPALARVVYDGPMMQFWRSFLGGDVRHFDFTWFRSVFPGNGTPSHSDIVYMGRGTPNLYTAWTPIGDIDTELGGLMVLEGSNNHQRLRDTYCQIDVDAYCENRNIPEARKNGRSGWLGQNPNQIRRTLGGRWLSTPQYRAGDVLVFSVFTVHAGMDNQTADRIRLSSDTRYQLACEPADERWIGNDPIAHGPKAKKGMIC